MAHRKRPARPVEIVLTEEDLAAIIGETLRAAPAAPPPPAHPPASSLPPPAPSLHGDAPYAAVADRAWHLGVRSPGAVGDAIRMILEATTLERGKRDR